MSVPINVYYPPKEERVSHFRPGVDFTRISVLNTVLCFLSLIYALPMAFLRYLDTFIFTVISLLVFVTGSLAVLTPFARVYVPICRWANRKPLAISGLLHQCGIMVTRLLRLFSVRVTIQNLHSEMFNRPAILICNHQSYLDLIVQLSMTKKIVFLTNDWVWNSPYFGYVIRNAEYYPVSMGIKSLLPKVRDLLQRGYSVSIFPEGTRSEDCTINRFHKGAFALAKELDVDIIPLILYGAGKVLPKKGWYMRKWPIQLHIGSRINNTELKAIGDTDREICKWFRKYYKAKYEEISDNIEKNV